MKIINLRVITVVACLIVAILPRSIAQDWSQWRGSNQDGSISGFIAPEQWPDNMKKSWSAVVGEGDASPALVDGKIYVFSRQENQEIIRCLDAKSGTELWKSAYDSIELKGAARSHSGPRSSPAIAEGKVVTLGVAGVLTCFDAENGKVLWRKHELPDQHPDYYTSSSPMIVDGLCVVQLGGKESGIILACDLDDGSEAWRWEGDPPAYASPALMTVEGEKHIVALTHLNLVGISAKDGQLLWKYLFAVPRMSTNSATPVVDGQTVIYSAQKRGVNALRIEKKGDGYSASPLWSTDEISTAYNTPVLIDNLLFGISERRNLYCLDTQTGKVSWTDEAKHETFGAIVNARSALFALPSNGVLTVYEPSGSRYTQIAQYQVSDSATYSYPIVSGSQIYIQDQNAITSWSVR